METQLTLQTLTPNLEFTHLASEEQIAKTRRALEANRMQTIVVETGDEARERVLDMIPEGAQVYNSTSRTLDQIRLAEAIENSPKFQAIRPRLRALDRATQRREIRRLSASPDVLVGSVHAITEVGQVLVASASGSQLGPAAFGAGLVIWVVGTQKIVRTLEDGFRRIREYSYPLEDVRTRKVYGQPSAINKILIVNGELPERIKIILVKQNLGF
jgi:L-lactate utilization protein LutC